MNPIAGGSDRHEYVAASGLRIAIAMLVTLVTLAIFLGAWALVGYEIYLAWGKQ